MQRQSELARAVCEEQGWQLVDLPPDEGVSAFKVKGDERLAANMHKGNLGAFLAKAKAGEVKPGSVLIIEKLDRFSRNYFDIVFPVWLNLLQSGIEIYSCVSRVHYTLTSIRANPALAGMALLEMSAANEYSATLSYRVRRAHGLRLAAAAKGGIYAMGSWAPAWVKFIGKKGEPGVYEFNEHADTVRRVVREYLDGQSMYSISRGLVRDKVKSLKKGTWTQGTVGHLLHSPALGGDALVKGTKLAGYFPAVISKADHQRLLGKLAEHSGRKGGDRAGQRIVNLFRNRVKCAHCGKTIATCNSQFYICKNRTGGGDCEAKGCVTVRRVEDDFFALVLMEHPALLLGRATIKRNGTVAALRARIRDLDKALDDAADLIGQLPLAAVQRKLTALAKQRETAGQELERASAEMLSAESAPAAFENLKATLAGFAKLGEGYAGTKQEAALAKAWRELRRQLADGEIRQRLLNIIPALVNHLELDIPGKRYRVVNHAGERSGWRSVAGR